MLRRRDVTLPRAKVPADGPLEDLHHHAEQRLCERRVPAALRGRVADEGVLGLHLDEGRGDVGVLERLADEVAALAGDVGVLGLGVSEMKEGVVDV